MRYGAGAGASRLVSGTMRIHRRLEERLADFERTEAALLFGSGYLANIGVVQALAREGDVVFSDAPQPREHHRRLPAGRAPRPSSTTTPTWSTWPGACDRPAGAAALIVTDGVFSMDGDVAPLAEIVELARDHDVRVMVDEAHGTGALGPERPRRRRRRGRRGRGGRDRRHARQGARLLRRLRVLRPLDGALPGEHRPHASSSPPPSRRRRWPPRMAALELLREQPRRVEKLQRNAGVLRDALARRGARRRRGEHADRAAGHRRRRRAPWPPASARSPRGVRPGHPAAHRARRHLAAAAGGDGLPHQVGAARRGQRRWPRRCPPAPRPVRAAPPRVPALGTGRIFDRLADAA